MTTRRLGQEVLRVVFPSTASTIDWPCAHFLFRLVFTLCIFEFQDTLKCSSQQLLQDFCATSRPSRAVSFSKERTAR